MICRPCRQALHENCHGQRHPTYCDCQHHEGKVTDAPPSVTPEFREELTTFMDDKDELLRRLANGPAWLDGTEGS